MFGILLAGAVLVGLLTAAGPYVDSKGMRGCSNIVYMMTKGICMTAVLLIGASSYCAVRGIRLADIAQPSRLGLATLSVFISIGSVWSLLYLIKRYGPGMVVPVYVVTAALLCFLVDAHTKGVPPRPRDLACLAGTGVLLYLLYEGRSYAEDTDAQLF